MTCVINKLLVAIIHLTNCEFEISKKLTPKFKDKHDLVDICLNVIHELKLHWTKESVPAAKSLNWKKIKWNWEWNDRERRRKRKRKNEKERERDKTRNACDLYMMASIWKLKRAFKLHVLFLTWSDDQRFKRKM